MTRSGRLTSWAGGLALAATACRGAPAGTAPARAPFDPVLAVASFDTAWARIGATYYDTTFRGHDWSQVRASFRPLAERARSVADTRAAIESLYVRLGDSHFALIPGEVASAMRADSTRGDGRPGHLGIDVRMVDGRLLIATVAPGSQAARLGIRPGWELTRVGALRVRHLLNARDALPDPRHRRRAELQVPLRVMAAMRGDDGSLVELEVRQPGGRTARLAVARTPWLGDVVKYGPLPPQYFAFSHERIADGPGCVGVIRFSVWMTPLLPRLERAMDELGGCRGIVLDLRGNTGGVAALVMGASGFFVDRHVSLGTLTARGTTLRYMVNPRRSNRRGDAITPYAGALAIVVDELTASTSELFAASLRDLGRARVFGDTTAGEALPATMTRLPNGDLLIHAIADFHAAGGERIEASGVAPDAFIPVTRRDLLAGRDAALVGAISWAGSVPAVQASATATGPSRQP